MKRKIILFFTAIITILMLTACSGGIDNAKQGKYYLNSDTSKSYIVIGENNTMGFYDIDFSEMEKYTKTLPLVLLMLAVNKRAVLLLMKKKSRKSVTK